MPEQLTLDCLYNDMEVTYRTSDSYNSRSGEPFWSDWESGKLYLMRREKDLPKRERGYRDDWKSGAIIGIAVGDSAEFKQSDYQEAFGFFDNGEGWKLQIKGLGNQ